MSIQVTSSSNDKNVELTPQDMREIYYAIRKLETYVKNTFENIGKILRKNNIDM